MCVTHVSKSFENCEKADSRRETKVVPKDTAKCSIRMRTETCDRLGDEVTLGAPQDSPTSTHSTTVPVVTRL